jgi:hypothetical protein
MKPTAHLGIAAALAVVAIGGTASALIGGAGSYSTPVRELRVVGAVTRSDVQPADRAIQAVVPELAEGPAANPFNPRRNSSPVNVRIPPPPPPRVEYPALPVLPAARK